MAIASGPAQSPSALPTPGFKFLLIAILTIAMGVPLFLIDVTLWDRQDRASEAASDVGSGWGGPQTVAGPMRLPRDGLSSTVAPASSLACSPCCTGSSTSS